MKFCHLFGQSDRQQKHDLQDQDSETAINYVGHIGKHFPTSHLVDTPLTSNSHITKEYWHYMHFFMYSKKVPKNSVTVGKEIKGKRE